MGMYCKWCKKKVSFISHFPKVHGDKLALGRRRRGSQGKKPRANEFSSIKEAVDYAKLARALKRLLDEEED